MKKFLIVLAFLAVFSLEAQTKTVKSPNVTVDVNGNFREKVDVYTGKLYIDKNGKSFPVYMSKSGKLYCVTGISAKTGKPKRKYIKP